MNYKEIMYTVGQLVRCVYGVDVPVNVQNTIIRYPAKGIGLMNQRGDIINTENQDEVMRLMNKIPSDLTDPKDKMEFDAQGAFWLGYYHYAKITDDVANYGANELTVVGNALYGDQWQTALSRDLELSSSRRLRAWLSGERKIPTGIWFDVVELLKARHLKIGEIIKKMA
ncbi:hypothetical protein EUX52_07460 [Haemophilus haemolyticus]|uniref:Uncharacterized protein n=1 Tax=Haemophilus haemolyticus TaxID=726 RepID=A0A502LMJ5_HAEHA|nr:hypothetical protein [Haemophilus haemolyticus]TPH20647.1 hypothetical protein EUX52_07460 [Haemophilus haemolyticus]